MSQKNPYSRQPWDKEKNFCLPVQCMCARQRITIIITSTQRTITSPDNYSNCLLFIAEDRHLSKYRKKHLLNTGVAAAAVIARAHLDHRIYVFRSRDDDPPRIQRKENHLRKYRPLSPLPQSSKRQQWRRLLFVHVLQTPYYLIIRFILLYCQRHPPTH